MRVLNRDVVEMLDIPDEVIDAVAQREQRELERREHAYREGRPPHRVAGRTIVLVDDGLATGATMRAAVSALRLQRPRRLVIGVPVAAPDVCDAFRAEADDIVCAATPAPFVSVGLWYDDFSETADEEVRDLLRRAAAAAPRAA